MSEFRVEVVRVDRIERHPDADNLSIARVNGDYPVIFRTGDHHEGELAVHVPIDSIVPDTPEWAFLGGHRRIRAKRLRGIFSMGVLAPIPCLCTTKRPQDECPRSWALGRDVREEMGIVKHDPRITYVPDATQEPEQPWMPKYTDIEGLRRFPRLLVEGEDVVVTEKIHGANGRWCFRDDRLWVGSHNCMRREDPGDVWWQASSFFPCIREYPGLVFYGEVFGAGIQDLAYGLGAKLRGPDDHRGLSGSSLPAGGPIDVRMFDIFDSGTMRYLDHEEMVDVCGDLGISIVPTLYNGPWSDKLRELAEGKTTLGADHVREGFVVRPVHERWDGRIGRVILKMVGEGYLLRKGA